MPITIVHGINPPCFLFSLLLLGVSYAKAAQPLAPGTLPVPASNWLSSGQATSNRNGNTLNISQNTGKAILNWQTFNVAPGAKVNFLQPNSAASTLNRIGDANPSIIQGAVNANGNIYLINQNGILFDRGAQINVGGLVASTLDITDETFLKGVVSTDAYAALPFTGGPLGMVRVETGAELKTAGGGEIWLFAPTVENAGIISTPDGQTLLAAGQKVYLTASSDARLRGVTVELEAGGTALNVGNILAQRGNATLAGLAINQRGYIGSTTTISRNGSIYLQAAEKVTTDHNGNPVGEIRKSAVSLGSGSITEITPELASSETSTDAQIFMPSILDISGNKVTLESDTLLRAPAAIATIAGLGKDSRITLEKSAHIDVSGLQNVTIPVERNFIDVQLRANELKDSPQQKNGFLQGKTVTIDARVGTPLADVSAAIAGISRGVAERSTTGGSINLNADEVVLKPGSEINVSGGSILYQGGYDAATRLLTVNGQSVDIGQATTDQVYVGFADRQTFSYGKWGVTETFTKPKPFKPGYLQGLDAGTLSFSSPVLLLDGTLSGSAQQGLYQTSLSTLAKGGLLQLGSFAGTENDYKSPDILLTPLGAPPLLDSFSINEAIPAERAELATLNSKIFGSGGFTRASFASNGKVTIDTGAKLNLGAGGSLAIKSRSIEFLGALNAAGGNFSLTTVKTSYGGGSGIHLGTGADISLAGNWSNNSALISDRNGIQVLNGGRVNLAAVESIHLDSGSSINVSGGANLSSHNQLIQGTGGSISLTSGKGDDPSFLGEAPMTLLGSLLGYGVQQGGSLSLNAARVTLGQSAENVDLVLTAGNLNLGGFENISITGTSGLNLTTNLDLVLHNLQLKSGYSRIFSNNNLISLTDIVMLPPEIRRPVNLSLNGSSNELQADIHITTEAGGSLSLDGFSKIAGSLYAPGGKISLTNSYSYPIDTDFDGGIALWLAPSSRLSVAGTSVVSVDRLGRRSGKVMDGGNISITANNGYLITAPGSELNVSGTQAVLDLPVTAANSIVYQPHNVLSNAGEISISTNTGALLSGNLFGSVTHSTASGGLFSLTINGTTDPTLFPGNPRVLALQARSVELPANTRSDSFLTAENLGIARFSTISLQNSGFDQIYLNAWDGINYSGTINLKAGRIISLSAPTLTGESSANLQLNAPYMNFGNQVAARQTTTEPSLGTAQFSAYGSFIDLYGVWNTQGIAQMNLEATQDIRLQGVQADNGGNLETTLVGQLDTSAEVNFKAAQLYPTTLSQYKINLSGNPEGKFTLMGNGSIPSAPLSAGGAISINARDISIGGVIRAPLGSLHLNADDTIVLNTGSQLSVSGSGLNVPFGQTLNGSDWLYYMANDTIQTLTAPPAKSLTLKAADINVANGAGIDASAGGNLSAWEFVPGNGGSSDILAAAETYAIIPGFSGNIAPLDWQNIQNHNLKVGDSVYLSGIAELPASHYILLPAHYALQQGAYAITLTNTYSDMSASQNTVRSDGSYLVAGYRTVAETSQRDSRWSGFIVSPGSLIRKSTAFTENLASKFFADTTNVQLPTDAGHLILNASSNLTMDGVVNLAATSGKGGIVDITSSAIEVLSDSNSTLIDASALHLSASNLTGIGAASLLLGGTRNDQGTLDITAETVTINNDTLHPLAASEILIGARNTVKLTTGSNLISNTKVSNSNTSTKYTIAGAGALLRLSNDPQASIMRSDLSEGASSTGNIEIAPNAQLIARGSLQFDATAGTRIAENAIVSAPDIALAATRIAVGEIPTGAEGLLLTDSLLNQFNNSSALTLKSYSSLDFYGSTGLGNQNSKLKQLTLDTPELNILGIADHPPGYASISSDQLTLKNTNNASSNTVTTGTGKLNLTANNGNILFGPGDIVINGIQNTTLTTSGNIRFQTSGSINLGGDLFILAGHLDSNTGQNYSIHASGLLKIMPSSNNALEVASGLGAHLNLTASRIEQNGFIDLPAGILNITANGLNGNDGISLGVGSITRVTGSPVTLAGTTIYPDAGHLNLTSDHGNVIVEQGATLDVSANSSGGNAGSFAINATEGRFLVAGNLLGNAASGHNSGSANINTGFLDNFPALSQALEAGQFHESLVLRAHQGNVAVADSLYAENIVLSADNGNIEITGNLLTGIHQAGDLALWAGNDINILPGAALGAYGHGQSGGSITLGTNNGAIHLYSGSTLNVSPVDNSPTGNVFLRTPRSQVDQTILQSAFQGTDNVGLEAFKVFQANNTSLNINNALISEWKVDSQSFMAKSKEISASILAGRTDIKLQLQPGIEQHNSGDIVLANTLNLASISGSGADWRYGRSESAGILTLRAEGNLKLNNSLSDGFTTETPSGSQIDGNSWSYRLIAGADTSAAAPLSVLPQSSGNGNLSLAAGKLVRTGTGSIDVAAGGNIHFGNGASAIYSAGQPGLSMEDFTAASGSNYPVNGGNISLTALGDISVQTGPSNQAVNDWLYRQGKIDSNGDFSSENTQTSWWVVFSKFQQNIGALAGGNIAIHADGNITNVSTALPTTGRMSGTTPNDSNLLVTGGGNLDVQAGGNLSGGVFYVAKGKGTLHAGGNIQASSGRIAPLLALGDGSFNVSANGSAVISSVFNPTLTPQNSSNTSGLNASYFSTYGADTGLSISSTTGDVSLVNNISRIWSIYKAGLGQFSIADVPGFALYPTTVSIIAANGNAELGQMSLFPAALGNLSVLTNHDINVKGTITVSDQDPGLLPGITNPSRLMTYTTNKHAPYGLLHANDLTPITFIAANGNISGPADGIFGNFPKAADLIAGGDINDVTFVGQNLRESDITRLQAGGDISFSNRLPNASGIKLGGPGILELSAGGNIDFGGSAGLRTMAELLNSALPNEGANIVLSVGLGRNASGQPGVPAVNSFLDKYLNNQSATTQGYLAELVNYLAQQGLTNLSTDSASAVFRTLPFKQQLPFLARILYAELLANGRDSIGGNNFARAELAIKTLFPVNDYQGDLKLYLSQIKTERGGDINILAPGGGVNAGLATPPKGFDKTASELGIVTQQGGHIQIFADQDVTVNQSRVFTLGGGNILVWSSNGNIDAGNGAKNTAYAPPPTMLIDSSGKVTFDISAAASGSGIGVLLTSPDIPAGSVDLIAPKGIVDAGDAGIRASGNLNVVAVHVLNADNIQVAGTTKGIPVAANIPIGVSALGSLQAESTESLRKGLENLQPKNQPSFVMPSILTVEVIGLGE